MAKTNFSDGTIVEPAFLNAVQEHLHDGLGDDGHAPQVRLDSDVANVLPFGNLPNMRMYKDRSGLSIMLEDRHITVGLGTASATNIISSGGIYSTPLIVANSSLRKCIIDALGIGIWSGWTAGVGGGAVPSTASGWSAAITDGLWLHVFVLGQSADRIAFEIGVDTSLTATNLREVASAYNLYRRIGSVMIINVGGVFKIRHFINHGRRFLWTDGICDMFMEYSDQEITFSNSMKTTQIPPGVNVLTLNRVMADARPSSSLSVHVDDDGTDRHLTAFSPVYVNSNKAIFEVEALSNTTQQIKVSADSSGVVAVLQGHTYGWIEEPDLM